MFNHPKIYKLAESSGKETCVQMFSLGRLCIGLLEVGGPSNLGLDPCNQHTIHKVSNQKNHQADFLLCRVKKWERLAICSLTWIVVELPKSFQTLQSLQKFTRLIFFPVSLPKFYKLQKFTRLIFFSVELESELDWPYGHLPVEL